MAKLCVDYSAFLHYRIAFANRESSLNAFAKEFVPANFQVINIFNSGNIVFFFYGA